LQYEFIDFFAFHFQDEEILGWEEEVEHVGWEEDVEVMGLEETFDGGQDSVEKDDKEEEVGHDEEEGHGEGAGLDDKGVGDNRYVSGFASTRQFRSSHLVHPPIAPREDNWFVIVPCGDG
jgi:hypothetical protein